MRVPRTKPLFKAPKMIDKSVNTVKRTQRIINKIDEQLPDTYNDNAEHYAVDNMTGLAGEASEKVAKTAYHAGEKVITKEYDITKEHIQKQRKFAKQQHVKSQQNQSIQNNKIKTNRMTQANHSTRNTNQTTSTLDSKGRPLKTKSNGNVFKPKTKSMTKSIANANKAKKAVKQPKKTVKTAKQTAKATQKTARTTAKLAQQMAIRTKQAVKVTYTTIKAIIKATVTAIKAIIAAIKSLIALIIAGGWITIVIIIIVGLIALIAHSPWGMFIDDGDDTTLSLSDCVFELEAAYTGTITDIITNAGEVKEIIYDGDSDTAVVRPNNWVDVLGVFSVMVTNDEDNPMDVMIMDDDKYDLLKEIFWEMNSIDYEIEETEIEPEPTPTTSGTPDPLANPEPDPEPIIERTLIITTSSKTYDDAIQIYNFNNKKIALLEELMSPEYYPLFMELCGPDSYAGLTPEQINSIINDLPTGTKGEEIVSYALTRLGDPYSQEKRGQGSFVDCSYLTRWCYQQAGISPFTAPTAASQAEYCVNNGLTIEKEDLQPGDLIFWSFKTNGRFMNVTHVGIYAGDGMVIDASASRGMVV